MLKPIAKTRTVIPQNQSPFTKLKLVVRAALSLPVGVEVKFELAVLDLVVIDNTDDEVVVTIAAPVVAAVADKVIATTGQPIYHQLSPLSSPISNSQSSLHTEGASNENT
jgi:hypothetical protein